MKLRNDDGLLEGYEALRQPGGRGQGRALLMSRGMTAWMQAWSALMPAHERQPGWCCGTRATLIGDPTIETPLPQGVEHELVRVLAQMAWAVARG
jgi:hypothetical protein